jgi:hypothetical protein
MAKDRLPTTHLVERHKDHGLDEQAEGQVGVRVSDGTQDKYRSLRKKRKESTQARERWPSLVEQDPVEVRRKVVSMILRTRPDKSVSIYMQSYSIAPFV